MLKFTFLGASGSLQELCSGNTSLLIRGERGCAAVDLSVNLPILTAAGIDTVILTHEHIDHIYALPSLLHQLWIGGRKEELTIHLPPGMEELTEGLIDLFGIRRKKGIFDIRLSGEPVFQAGTLRFTLFPTDHTGNSVGVVAEEGGDRLVYTSDTRPIKEIPAVMKGADILIHEASGVSTDEENLVKKGHSSGADAGAFAAGLGVRELYLCHLPAGEEARRAVLQEAGKYFPASRIPEILKEYHVPTGL